MDPDALVSVGLLQEIVRWIRNGADGDIGLQLRRGRGLRGDPGSPRRERQLFLSKDLMLLVEAEAAVTVMS